MNPDENHNHSSSGGNTQNPNNTHTDPVLDFTKGNNSTVMGVLSYLGPLVLIPFLMEKKDEFVKFHIKQGMVLFGLEIVIWLLSSMFYSMSMLLNLLNLATFILAIMGVINVIQGQKKELPVIGSLAQNIKI